MAVKGGYLLLAGGGGVMLWSAVRGKSWSSVLRNLIAGKSPLTATSSNSINSSFATATGSAGGGSVTAQGGSPTGSNAANAALGKTMAAGYGWATGAQWTALNNIVMAESGWSDTITNPSSDAAGIAQNISGFSSSYQSGNAAQQIAWLLSYIKSRYGDPITAWNFHLANGWY